MAKEATILLMEDDESVNRSVAFSLEKGGYQVLAARTVREAEELWKGRKADMVICDINLPDGSGLDFISKVRASGNAYILCLTALDEETDQVMGYGAGADDYVTKPFSLAVLLWKVRACMERLGGGRQEIHTGDLTVFPETQRVMVRGQEVSLTKNEWRLLLLFLEHPRQILSKEQILERMYDSDGNFVDENTVAVNVARLRGKLEDDKANPIYIKNIRGLGYLWNQECRRQGQ